MKRRYEKPMMAVEHYALTQTIAACSGIKITSSDSNRMPTQADILADPHVTSAMQNWIRRGGFLGLDLGCRVSIIGQTDSDGVCYHTNINAAFNS